VLITNPDWERTPTPEELAAAYPAAALAAHKSGHTRIACSVEANGTLYNCSIYEESPPGLGFGRAAVFTARYFKMRTKTVDGMPVTGASVIVPMRWQAPVGDASPPPARVDPTGPASPGPQPRIIADPDWLRLPHTDQMAMLFPPAAMRRHASGYAKVQCKVRVDGSLADCVVIEEAPPGLGFGKATIQATHFMLMRPKAIDGVPVDGGMVIIPMRWVQPR
jgi:TonB family protein